MSSLQYVDDGGYRVEAFVAWQTTYSLSLDNGQSETFTIPGARSNVFTARHQVRESQAVVARSRGNWGGNHAPCSGDQYIRQCSIN
ncbi:MAG: hypothetical protein M3069_12375 [Chloroflexota bacterium]|nr:hypothetical protein [Chloroflexota bacterium]